MLTACSSEGGGGAAAEDLSSYLPDAEGGLAYADLVGIKVTYGVDLAADPLDASERSDFGYYGLVGAPLPILTRRFDPELIETLALDDATEAAGLLSGDAAQVSVIKSDADLEQVEADLEAIGFEPAESGALIRDREDETTAIRLIDDRIFLAPSEELLEMAQLGGGDPPVPVVSELEGLAIEIDPRDDGCLLSRAAVASEEGIGELVFEVDGEPSVNGPTGDDASGEIVSGDAVVDGDLVVLPVSGGERESAPAQAALEDRIFDYDCESPPS